MVWAVVVVTAAGFVRLFVEVRPLSLPVLSDQPPLVSAHRTANTRPLLVIGLDGGDWRALRPLMAEGRVPTLARLAADGVQGQVEALWPPYLVHPRMGERRDGLPPGSTRCA